MSIEALPSPAEYRALAEVRFQIRKFLAFSEDAARSAGVNPQQHQLLLAVKGLPEGERATIGTLASRLVLKHHSVVELADRLVRRGLLVKRVGERDRREMLLVITPKGEKILHRLSVAHEAELRAAGPTLIEALEAIVAPRRRTRQAKASKS